MSNAPYRPGFVPRDRSVMGGQPAGTLADGRIRLGNIDPYDRPVLNNGNGSVSTARSFSVDRGKGEELLPSVINGERFPESAVRDQMKDQNMGTFPDWQTADGYARQVHNDQARRMGRPQDAPNAPIDTLTGARIPDAAKLARVTASRRSR